MGESVPDAQPAVERPAGEHRRVEQHEAADRFGKVALRTAHDLGRALGAHTDPAGGDPGCDPAAEPVVVRTDGPHRSLDGLAALIDAALAENDAEHDEAGDPSSSR